MNQIQKALSSVGLFDILKTRSNYWDGSPSIFGTLGRQSIPMPTNADFIPLDAYGDTLDLKGTNVNATWLGLESKAMQFWAYRLCSPLAAVIDRIAEADTNGRIQFLDSDMKPIKTNKVPTLNRIANLLKNPNPLQTAEEFNSEQVVLCKIFGYCPVLAVGPAGMDKTYTRAFFNLNPVHCTPLNEDGYNAYKHIVDGTLGQNPIKEWKITLFGQTYFIPAEDILLVKDGFVNTTSDDFGLPLSKLSGLDYWISNICAAMEADNVLLRKKGPLGVFSHDPKPDVGGWTPLTPIQQKEIQSDLQRYGLTLGQLQYIVSKTPIKWNAMSFNLRDLMTKETVRQGIDGICDRFGYPAELMSGKNATYENRSSAEKFLYQTVIIPFSLRRMARYDKFFGLDDHIIYMNYDHLPVLQEDVVKASSARQARSQSLEIDWKNGIITWNEWRTLQELPVVAGMDIYYPEWMKQFGKDIIIKNETSPKDTSTKK